MRRLAFLLFTFVALSSYAQDATTDSITANGKHLLQLLDSSKVEDLWPSGYRVDWETGVPIAVSSSTHSTHCSAFAASFSKKLGIYLLHPPQHKQNLLANAQFDWLQSDEAAKEGWMKVATALEAQNLANKGYLVVTATKNPDETRPGHVAVIRPAIKSLALLQEEGPQVTQSGKVNHYSISLIKGFANHPGAWPNGVIFYEHSVDWDKVY
jgi:hypothetical protein